MKKLVRGKTGMTLAELLAVVLLISMLSLMIGGGITAIKASAEKETKKAEAGKFLTLTAELLTDELSGALAVKYDDSENLWILSRNEEAWILLKSTPDMGICKVYSKDGEEEKNPLIPAEILTDGLSTAFEELTYENGCFTVKRTAVLWNHDGEPETLAILPELSVRAVNLN